MKAAREMSLLKGIPSKIKARKTSRAAYGKRLQMVLTSIVLPAVVLK
jgi:hypothetical protein